MFNIKEIRAMESLLSESGWQVVTYRNYQQDRGLRDLILLGQMQPESIRAIDGLTELRLRGEVDPVVFLGREGQFWLENPWPTADEIAEVYDQYRLGQKLWPAELGRYWDRQASAIEAYLEKRKVLHTPIMEVGWVDGQIALKRRGFLLGVPVETYDADGHLAHWTLQTPALGLFFEGYVDHGKIDSDFTSWAESWRYEFLDKSARIITGDGFGPYSNQGDTWLVRPENFNP